MAKADNIVQDVYNLKIHEIKILGDSGEVYQIVPNMSSFSYVSMEMTEGMFEASVVGNLIIRDLNSTAEQINFMGFEDLVVKFENPEIPNSYKSLRFKIYNVAATDDQISNNRIKEDVNITNVKLVIQFCSYEHYLLNYREFSELAGFTGAGSTGADIITKIASDPTVSRAVSAIGSPVVSAIAGALDTRPVGLVNVINDNYFKTGKVTSDTTQKDMYIEPTGNWIWYKQNQTLYPWGKLTRPVKATQLMQFLAEYAVGEKNPNACNFLFWQDLDRWNFRSIESLLKESVVREYEASSSPTQTKNIYSLQVVQESNFLRLFESNAIAAKYFLVEPKWDQPYREYLDYNESHSIKEITFDYFQDYNKWLKVEKYPLFDKSVDTKPTVANIVNDNISGYFSPSYSNRDKTVEWEHHGYTLSNRDSMISWQPMFDQVDLDGAICKKIQKEIKQKIKDKKVEYATKKNLKEKWKVYRCSICCDNRYQDTTALDEIVFTPQYGVVAAGAFSDMVNYDSFFGVTGSTGGISAGVTGIFPTGLSLSYDFESEPFNTTIGDLMYLRETPDLQTKYLYDLELKRIDIAKETIQNSITRLQVEKEHYNSTPICSDDVLNSGLCEENALYLQYFGGECFCTEEKKSNFIKSNYTIPITNREELLASPYFDSMTEIIISEKENFTKVYEEYKNRKAFFISNQIGFTADNSQKNLFNIKSIKRVPIRGSKYEKLAQKSVVSQLVSSLGAGVTANFKGFPIGATSYYPYEIFYNNDNTIDPKIKHPHYDSGYNFDVGYQVNPIFSQFDPIGGPNSGSAGDPDPYKIFTYYITARIKTVVTLDTTYHTSAPYVDPCPGCNCAEGGGFAGQACQECCNTPLPDPCNDVETKNTNSTTQSFDNRTFNDRDPNNLTKTSIISKIINETIKSFHSGWVISDVTSTSFTATYTEPDICRLEKKTIKHYNFNVDTVYTNNKGNEYLSQFDSGICVLEPFGLERIKDFNPIDYLNSRNFTDIQPPVDDEEPKRPIENILEEIESFVRVEFQKPIGTNTLYDFPKGFYDTPGSEYYVPYHVLLTAGPFGTKSVDYNISVLGQDPYGFDVAVKRIKRKKQNLKPQNKALVNNKDYHVVEKGYSNSAIGIDAYTGFYSYGDSGIQSYGENLNIRNISVNGTNTGFYTKNIFGKFGFYDGNPSDTDNNRVIFDRFGNASLVSSNRISSFYENTIANEAFYNDSVQSVTRTNPLSLPTSYFEINNIRPLAVRGAFPRIDSNFYSYSVITKPAYRISEGIELYSGFFTNVPYQELLYGPLLSPANVFNYVNLGGPLPISTDYFKSNASYHPGENYDQPWISLFEMDLRNRNDRVEPEEETAFYGYYYGSAIWQHPQLAGLTASVWKNDISGETEYGIVGPELEEDDSTFDRNFAAQFVVMSRESIEFDTACAGYRCSNPNPVDNTACPDENPLCNCPCQELRPDRLSMGITGPEPTFKELKKLEEEIKECTLIEEVLGEDWLGCAWNDSKSPLNCNCPCIGKHFLDYLKYSQIYCTFWNTPPERPLYRNAQMMQINANKISVKLNGDFTLRPGMKVKLNLGTKRYSGVWLVSTINHDIAKTKHMMDVTMIRDSESGNHDNRATKLKLNTQ
jgi:hypothetical protein